ncbi:4a-hydroxytetrahydrobiopterin dehydratase [Paucibacter sp. APW11]|uniref:Putative pterin-4-alpha-carbinolamine dehydratase n=1 Tax=Roseateles aquae TaxID=3077235 RepID=A0ABU3P6D2_9BURK|nr:4a-hydroxytetrahydrobiopterin dehydratase [Paucibacter sp. APW11]MDT8998113.1 4a-hydroxytetrahydrobiopterin dehydratase [Paucibacter sp. APW11]
MNLLLAQCTPQNQALSGDELNNWLAQVPGWLPDPEAKLIGRRFEFDNFYQVMAFVNAVAEIAHAQDHHPEMMVSYAVCTVSFSTHSAQGLSANDFICAAQVSALPEASAA